MKTFFKKYSNQLAFWLIPPNLLLTSNVSDDSKERQKEQKKWSAHEKEVVDNLPTREITPPLYPIVRDPVHIYTEGDFIWWKSHVDGLEYAVSGVDDTNGISGIRQGHNVNPDFDFTPGLKFAIGGDFHDGWDLFSQYTWLASESEDNEITRDPLKGLFSTHPVHHDLIDTFYNFPITDASSTWEQQFNVLDIGLGRNFFVSRYLSLRPNFGLKFSWIKMEVATKYTPNSSVASFPLGVGEVDFTQHQRSWGLGIRGGLNSMWYFTRNWGLYADFFATALWSNFHDKMIQTETTGATSTTTYDSKEKVQTLIPVLETSLGLRYQLWINDARSQFYAQAGWEGQIWVNFNHLSDMVSRDTGDFSLHGLTLKIGFAF